MEVQIFVNGKWMSLEEASKQKILVRKKNGKPTDI